MEYIKLESSNVKTEQEEVGGKKYYKKDLRCISIHMKTKEIFWELTNDGVQEVGIESPVMKEVKLSYLG